jgi:hypothetical protein
LRKIQVKFDFRLVDGERIAGEYPLVFTNSNEREKPFAALAQR